MCRKFPSTFKGAARKWYTSLAPSSISRFSQLKDAFIGHFASSCAFSRAAPGLLRESLREFMARFNKVYIQIPGLSGEVAVVALQTGLRPGVLTDDLILHPPRSFGELLQRARSYMTLEDQNRTLAARDTSFSRNSEWRNETRSDGPDRRGRQEKRSRDETSVPADLMVPRGTCHHG
ncbi:hypothetical protein Dimus_039089 [Dionaea muscipula]